MSKRKFIYNVATLALATWNTTRLVEALHNQSNEIAKKVTTEIAKQKLKTRREGADAVAGIAHDVFSELGRRAPGLDGGPIYDVNESMLRDALGKVVDQALA